MWRYVFVLVLVGACAQPSRGIDWYDWTKAMTASGRMSQATSEAGLPISRVQLVENFEKIAFALEARPLGLPGGNPKHKKIIRKWLKPIRYAIVAPDGSINRVQPGVMTFAERLTAMTGHSILPVQPPGAANLSQNKIHEKQINFLILYGPDAFFREISRGLRAAPRGVRAYVDRWRIVSSPCAGAFLGDTSIIANEGELEYAAIMIRQEVPDLLLDACIQEELTQTMGLLNDDSSVAPSIFNDDQAYAFLTEHDEMLLRILYDPRLAAGMTPDVAMPIVRQIAAELLPDA